MNDKNDRRTFATKCPVCGTYFEKSDTYMEVECFGVGQCPAREAGPRPSLDKVLCACNRRWIDGSVLVADHGYDDCEAYVSKKELESVSVDDNL